MSGKTKTQENYNGSVTTETDTTLRQVVDLGNGIEYIVEPGLGLTIDIIRGGQVVYSQPLFIYESAELRDFLNKHFKTTQGEPTHEVVV